MLLFRFKEKLISLISLASSILLTLSCTHTGSQPAKIPIESSWPEKCKTMVYEQIEKRGVKNRAVLAALSAVPRHKFVPLLLQAHAYDDGPLPIGAGQTISQPYIVAYMTELLDLKPESRVLEIGTGSGYQAAVLSKLAKEVYSVEIIDSLTKTAAITLAELACNNVFLKTADGYKGWPEKAPFDAIIVTAAPETVPQPLLAQLKVGGVLVIPVGKEFQEIRKIKRTASGYQSQELIPVRFVPMTGEVQKKRK